MFAFLTAGLVLAVLSFQKKEIGEIEKIGVLGTEKTASPAAIPLLVVDLAGAVKQPGVFRLPEGSRLQDLLPLAGGLSAAADPAWIEKNLNLAERLFDGEKIYIPARGEAAPPGGGQAGSGAILPRSGTKVNINTASAAQLKTSLPGLSLADAENVVKYRQEQGRFADISEIQRVGGIKAGKFAKIKDLITVN